MCPRASDHRPDAWCPQRCSAAFDLKFRTTLPPVFSFITDDDDEEEEEEEESVFVSYVFVSFSFVLEMKREDGVFLGGGGRSLVVVSCLPL